MMGGAGDDTYIVDNIADIVTEKAAQGIDTVSSRITYGLADTDGAGSNGANVENLTLTGTAALNGTGNALNNVLTGNAAANALDGGSGADTMAGGAGNDVYYLDNIGDAVTEVSNEGTDTVISSITFSLALAANVENLTLSGTDMINATGNALNNVLIGNSANNTLAGYAGSDTLNGRAGADTMMGGLDGDTYYVDNAGDVVTENSTLATEIDTVNSLISYTLGANVENLNLTGTTAINGTGNALNNALTGNTAANSLNGDLGNDTLNGDLGNDVLTGGAGQDSFQLTTAGNVDRITDFSVVDDTIQLENALFTQFTATGTLAAGMFRSGTGITAAADANDYLIYNSTDGKLYYDQDANGAGAAVQIALIGNLAALTAVDFVVI